ncbi:MAG: hypothetical protein HQ514_15070 [Rhodospirillales bacterium]|nr:hypothetical protein [Rhodospirillales bacterium]
MPDNDEPKSESDGLELIASGADELTHAELLCLYQDSEQNIRFSKLIQWRTTIVTLAIFICFAWLAHYSSRNGDMIKILIILTYVVGPIALYMLVIFQSWQGTERKKIQLIISNLSNLARNIYNTKSKREADVERYILLFFMGCAILTGGFLTLSRLLRWF